jgi:hypothetical protein
MGKAVKDSRPARAVLSAPYPLPIVITRSQTTNTSAHIEQLSNTVSAPQSDTGLDRDLPTAQREDPNRFLRPRHHPRGLQGEDEREGESLSEADRVTPLGRQARSIAGGDITGKIGGQEDEVNSAAGSLYTEEGDEVMEGDVESDTVCLVPLRQS